MGSDIRPELSSAQRKGGDHQQVKSLIEQIRERVDLDVVGLAVEHRGIEMVVAPTDASGPHAPGAAWVAYANVEQYGSSQAKLFEALAATPREAADRLADSIEDDDDTEVTHG